MANEVQSVGVWCRYDNCAISIERVSYKHQEEEGIHGAEHSNLSVFQFHSWDQFDGEKNELERFDYICGYFKDDPEMAMSWSLERAKANWTYDQITHWNNGVMDHDGDIDFEKLQKIMYTLISMDVLLNRTIMVKMRRSKIERK